MENYNKNDYLQKDEEYGFDLISVERVKKNKKLYIHIHYVNEETVDDSIFTLEYYSRGLFKDIKRHKEIQNAIKGKNIIDAIASIINQNNHLLYNFQLKELVKSLPESLIMDDNAMRDLLSKLQKDNKELLVTIGNQINDERAWFLEEKNKDIEAKKKFDQDYKIITEEFGL